MVGLAELPLARHRSEAIGIGEILDLDRRIERQKVATIRLRLRGQLRLVEIAHSRVRKRVAREFMAAAMKADDVVGAGPDPMARPLIHQPAGYVERAPRVVLLKHGSADSGGTFGDVIECEAVSYTHLRAHETDSYL